jgi:hypothetical protein
VSALRVSGRDHPRPDPMAHTEPAPGDADHSFASGAVWVCKVLVPAIERGNAELQPENIAVRLDLNLDPRSTNHAHVDFWLTETREGKRAAGQKCSINVIGNQRVWLYRPGLPGQIFGTINQCGPEKIQSVLHSRGAKNG